MKMVKSKMGRKARGDRYTDSEGVSSAASHPNSYRASSDCVSRYEHRARAHDLPRWSLNIVLRLTHRSQRLLHVSLAAVASCVATDASFVATVASFVATVASFVATVVPLVATVAPCVAKR